MAGITLAQAQAKLDLWLAAEESLATSQSYEITVEGNTRKLTRADLAEIGNRISYWNNKVVSLTAQSSGQSRSRTIRN
jgi:hypothetical protein